MLQYLQLYSDVSYKRCIYYLFKDYSHWVWLGYSVTSDSRITQFLCDRISIILQASITLRVVRVIKHHVRSR